MEAAGLQRLRTSDVSEYPVSSRYLRFPYNAVPSYVPRLTTSYFRNALVVFIVVIVLLKSPTDLQEWTYGPVGPL